MTLLNITVVPKSSRSAITVTAQGEIKVYLNSPPADGKANKECIQLFSKKLKIPKSHITIIKGDKSRKKTLELQGITSEKINTILTC